MAKSRKRAVGEEKGALIQMRVAADDKAAMQAAAEHDGRTLSAWIRWVALQAAKAKPPGGKT